MTRKDYVLLANAIAKGIDDANGANGLTAYAIIERIADALESDNPRFDRERFISATRSTREHREAIKAQLSEEVR